MLAQQQVPNVDVTRQDQLKINEFGANNARIHEIRKEKKQLQEKINQLDDACTEMMMQEGEDIHLMLGESFVLTSEESAQEYLEKSLETANESMQQLSEEEQKLDARQTELKKILYSRFGQNINLEES